jgi:hypothetical protein
MATSLVINIILSLIVLAGMVALHLWAIRTGRQDRVGVVTDRRKGFDRRTREAPSLPAKADRRRGDRRYGRAIPI